MTRPPLLRSLLLALAIALATGPTAPLLRAQEAPAQAPAPADPATLPAIRIISVGGTIDSTSPDRLDLANYGGESNPRKPLQEMVNELPELASLARVSVEEDILPRGGPGRTMASVLKLAKRVNEIFATEPDISGIIITQGTNNLEESAYFLHLTVQSEKPVVFVGAQRPSTALSSDGWLNLYNAVRIAASAESVGKGVLLAMNDEINSARDVKKAAAYRVQAFQSPDLGVLGYADPDKVVYYRTVTRRHTLGSEFNATEITALPQVDVQYSYLEASGAPIDALVAEGVKGIVIEGAGGGSASNQQNEAIKRAQAKGVIVVATTRTGVGRVIETNARKKAAIIPGDNLSSQKARILLQLALTATTDPVEIKRIFDQY